MVRTTVLLVMLASARTIAGEYTDCANTDDTVEAVRQTCGKPNIVRSYYSPFFHEQVTEWIYKHKAYWVHFEIDSDHKVGRVKMLSPNTPVPDDATNVSVSEG